MRVLIVEDDPDLRMQLNKLLLGASYSVDAGVDGEEGLYLGTEYTYDLAIIDLGLPKMNGIDLISQLREQGCSYPILILTARDHWQEKVKGLEVGADDYVVKPFHEEEILARLNALLRRSVGLSTTVVNHGAITLDTKAQRVEVDGNPIELTSYEYKVLEYLMLHPQEVVSKTQLVEHIYDQDFDRDSNVIEVFVGRLRKKLDPENTYKPIETLRGRGYRFAAADDIQSTQ